MGKIEITHRERLIIYYILHGFTNKQIAQKLFISHHTVKMHISNLMSRFNVRNKMQLMVTLISKNYISKKDIDMTNNDISSHCFF